MGTHKTILTLLLVVLASCTGGGPKENVVKNKPRDIVGKVDSSSFKVDKSMTQFVDRFESPININELKESSFLETTSGVLSISESENLCKPGIDGFFRFYFLIDKSDDMNSVFGKLKVFVPDTINNWREDFEGEHFNEIELKSDRIKLWEKIGVGTTLNELTVFIGENTKNIEDSLLTAELGTYSLRAIILKDTIKELSVGKYCN